MRPNHRLESASDVIISCDNAQASKWECDAMYNFKIRYPNTTVVREQVSCDVH